MMNGKYQKLFVIVLVLLGLLVSGPAVQSASAAFESGTTCTAPDDPGGHDKCLGPYNPSVNDTVTLPPDGILDYATYTVPAGVTVTFTKNAANTPVTIRTFGNVYVAGTINVSATSPGANTGTYGDGLTGDDGQPGIGGPGGYDGGFGSYSPLFGGATGATAGAGKGPGGGQAGSGYSGTSGYAGGAGSYGGAGSGGYYSAAVGATYGQATILPLVGGSGGGGGAAGSSFTGAGGGGGGGAILIAAGTALSPATITFVNTGRVYADGTAGGYTAGTGCGGGGGGGSGGAIRLVAETQVMSGSPWLEAIGAAGGSGCSYSGSNGGTGRIRLEATNLTGWNTGRSNPGYSYALPGHAMVPNNPTLMISSVTPTGGSPSSVPANPTGNADITFPQGTTAASVSLTATNIPDGTTVTVYVIPSSGAARTSVLSSALTAGAATANITLSPGNNVLLASATYSVTELIAMNLPTFDNGIRVAKIRVESTMNGESKVTYITASGKEYPADSPHRDKPQPSRMRNEQKS